MSSATRTSGILALGLAVALAGCGDKPAATPAGPPSVHEHHAPHGGVLQVLGDEAGHVELVLDEKTGKLTAYVLDGEAEKPVRVAQLNLLFTLFLPSGGRFDTEVAAVGNPLTGETAGDSSQFEGTTGNLRGVTAFEGILAFITARGVTFTAVPIGFPGGNEEKHDGGK